MKSAGTCWSDWSLTHFTIQRNIPLTGIRFENFDFFFNILRRKASNFKSASWIQRPRQVNWILMSETSVKRKKRCREGDDTQIKRRYTLKTWDAGPWIYSSLKHLSKHENIQLRFEWVQRFGHFCVPHLPTNVYQYADDSVLLRLKVHNTETDSNWSYDYKLKLKME